MVKISGFNKCYMDTINYSEQLTGRIFNDLHTESAIIFDSIDSNRPTSQFGYIFDSTETALKVLNIVKQSSEDDIVFIDYNLDRSVEVYKQNDCKGV